ncbi:MAG: hypothetical protein N3E50_05425 [Candidatus Goldbacteria bacterium]|nr:hypothetical protein [Candidatus Goldiibacteriota bacterium]
MNIKIKKIKFIIFIFIFSLFFYTLHSQTETPTPTETPTITPTRTPISQGVGSAVINPTRVAAGTIGNTMTITFTNGPDTWGNGTLKVIIPAGWSAPSLSGLNPGYYTVSVVGGSYVGTMVNGQTIIIYVNNLQANTGTVTIVYGSKALGGPGATSQSGTGTAIFIIENNPVGTNTYEIASSPQVDVVMPTPTVTFTFTNTITPTITPTRTVTPTVTITNTPETGEGSAAIFPSSVMAGGTGNTLRIEYTAGPSNWASAPGYGTLRITIPSGWSQPSISGTSPGYFTADSYGGTVNGYITIGYDMVIYVSGLPASTGKIIVTYGDKSAGGPGATAQSNTGTAYFIIKSAISGTNVNEIQNSPFILVAVATPTVTRTITPTYTHTPDSTPVRPSGLTSTLSGNSITLQWNTGLLTDYYRVYIATGPTGKLNPFPTGWQMVATVLPTPTITSFTHVDTINDYVFYVISGVNGAGQSKPSTVASKIRQILSYTGNRTNAYILSLPYVSKFSKASDIVMDIEGTTATVTKINRVGLWHPNVQAFSMYNYVVDNWYGINWNVDAGTSSSNAIYINLTATAGTFTWVINGTDKNAALVFNRNTGISNENLRHLPYSSIYKKASDIVMDIEGTLTTNAKISKIGKWHPDVQAYSFYYFVSGTGWVGIDFDLKPGDAVNIFPSSTVTSFTWTPKIFGE